MSQAQSEEKGANILVLTVSRGAKLLPKWKRKSVVFPSAWIRCFPTKGARRRKAEGAIEVHIPSCSLPVKSAMEACVMPLYLEKALAISAVHALKTFCCEKLAPTQT